MTAALSYRKFRHGYLARQWQQISSSIRGSSAIVRGLYLVAVFMLPAIALSGNANIGAAINWWYTPASNQDQPSISLHDYKLLGAPTELTEITHNASGLTYNRDTDSLFAVVNNPTKIVEMSKAGEELRVIKLEGFDDTEGLAYLGDYRFALVEEERRGIVLVEIHENTKEITRDIDTVSTFRLTQKKNKGFEGVAFNAIDQSLFVVNEKYPRALYRIDGVTDKNNNKFSVDNPWSMEEHSLGKRDLSGLHFLPDLGNLLVLSDESKSLTEISMQGERLSRLSLRRGSVGLESTIPQPEGITMDDQGYLYILSEPNLFYRFVPETSVLAVR